MLRLVVTQKIHIFEDEELDLCFVWNECCPYINVSHIEGGHEAFHTIECKEPIPSINDVEAEIKEWINRYE